MVVTTALRVSKSSGDRGILFAPPLCGGPPRGVDRFDRAAAPDARWVRFDGPDKIADLPRLIADSACEKFRSIYVTYLQK